MSERSERIGWLGEESERGRRVASANAIAERSEVMA